MLANEKFALSCIKRYASEGRTIDKTNGVFAHCPAPKCEGGTEGVYLTSEDHQHQGLIQSIDFGRMCFFYPDVKSWLKSADVWPNDFFRLWDLCEYYHGQHNKKISSEWWDQLSEDQKREHSQKLKDSYQSRTAESKKHAAQRIITYNQSLTREERAAKANHMREVYNNRATNEDKKRRSEKTRQDNNKQMEITYPSGLKGVYPSGIIASLFTGIPDSTLRSWARSNGCGKYGKNKGYSARYF